MDIERVASAKDEVELRQRMKDFEFLEDSKSQKVSYDVAVKIADILFTHDRSDLLQSNVLDIILVDNDNC